MDSLIELFISTAFVASTMRLAVPLILAGTGEVVSERAGTLNIGLEGMMLMGAFTAVLAADATGNPWLGALGGALGGMAVAAVHGAIVIAWSGDQIVSGLALNLGALGLTTYLSRRIFGTGQSEVAHFEPIDVPLLSDLPFLGPVLFSQSPFFYLALAAAAVLSLCAVQNPVRALLAGSGRGSGCARQRGHFRAPHALDRSARLRSDGRPGRSIDLAGTALHLHREHDGRSGFHRAGPGHRHPVAPDVGGGNCPVLRRSRRYVSPHSGPRLRSDPVQLSLMLPLVLTLVVYGFAARAGRPPAALGRPWMKS